MAAIRPARDWYLALLGALAFTLAAAAGTTGGIPAGLAPLARPHPAHHRHGRGPQFSATLPSVRIRGRRYQWDLVQLPPDLAW